MPKPKLPVYRKAKKDPGVPNLRVQKQKLLHQVEKHKQLSQGSGAIQKRKPIKSLSAFAQSAAQKEHEYLEQQKDAALTSTPKQRVTQTSKCFICHYPVVLTSSFSYTN